jgi:large subunit ribosomal protein L6
MSRIGRTPVTIPSGVTVTVDGRAVSVKGPKGTLEIRHRPEVAVEIEGQVLTVLRTTDDGDRNGRAFHGLTRALIQNMVIGVTDGYEKTLEINGVGYNCKELGNKLEFNLGFAHTVSVDVPKGIEIALKNPTNITIRGCDKQVVGELAARIRKLRPPEPYKGKGIKYSDEVIRRKAGKAFGSA